MAEAEVPPAVVDPNKIPAGPPPPEPKQDNPGSDIGLPPPPQANAQPGQPGQSDLPTPPPAVPTPPVEEQPVQPPTPPSMNEPAPGGSGSTVNNSTY